MTTKTKIKWRLSELPTGAEVAQLVKEGVLSKEEAREILFNQEDEEIREKKSLESEIKFLRDLVERLAKNEKSRLVEVIKEVQPIYIKQPWLYPYQNWCTLANNGSTFYGTNTTNVVTGSYIISDALGTGSIGNTVADCSFSEIKTF